MKLELRKENGELVKEIEVDLKNAPEVVAMDGKTKRAFVRKDCYKMTGSLIYIESPSLFLKA